MNLPFLSFKRNLCESLKAFEFLIAHGRQYDVFPLPVMGALHDEQKTGSVDFPVGMPPCTFEWHAEHKVNPLPTSYLSFGNSAQGFKWCACNFEEMPQC